MVGRRDLSMWWVIGRVDLNLVGRREGGSEYVVGNREGGSEYVVGR